jgi:O-antigen ligase
LLFAFITFGFFSSLFSSNLAISFYGDPYRKEGFVTYLAYTGLFISAYQLRSLNRVRCLLYPLIGGAFILGVFTVLNLDYINNVFTLTKKTSIFHNANHYAYFLNITILSTTILLFIDKKQHIILKSLYLITLGLLTYTLVDNGSFGSFIGASFGILFLSVFILLYFPKEKLTLLMIILIFSGSAFLASYDTQFVSNEVAKIVDNTGDIIEGNEDAPSAGSGRWSLWTDAFSFALEKPILGYGLDNLGEPYALVDTTIDRPHNEYLQIAASIGIPALLIYLSALALHFFDLLKKKSLILLVQVAIYSTLFAYLVGAFFGNSMYYTTPYFVILLAISISIQQKNSEY